MSARLRWHGERVTIWAYRLVATVRRRHEHDGGIENCSCGCPVIGCPPCGGDR